MKYTNKEYVNFWRAKHTGTYGLSSEELLIQAMLAPHSNSMKNAFENGFPILYNEVKERLLSFDFSLPTDTPYDITRDTSGT